MTESTTKVAAEIGEVTITREYDAPRDVVFRAMIEPEQLTHFWGPTGMNTPLDKIVIEPWAGGRFETTMVPDDDPDAEGYPMRAIFVEIVEPERGPSGLSLSSGSLRRRPTQTSATAARAS